MLIYAWKYTYMAFFFNNDMFPGSTYRGNIDEHGADDKYFTNNIMMQKKME